MSQREADRLHKNLSGGLPFPTPEGRKRPARPLRLRKSALSPAQAKSESSHGQSLIVWLKSQERLCPAFARTFHVANEHAGNDKKEYTRADGKCGVYSASAMRRKAEGVRPGIFDYFNLARQRGFSGLIFDLKVRDGELISAPDKEWDQVRERVWLHSQGIADHVCWSWAEAAALHAWYFGITNKELLRSIGRLDLWLVPELGGHDARCGCDVNLNLFLKTTLEEKIMNDKKENIDGQYQNQNGQPAEPRKEMPGETPVDHSVQELNDPRANDPNQTPTSKEDQAAYPAEHEERLAQELGAHGEATKSSLEAEHARKFQQEQAEIEERTHGTVATPATPPGQQPATPGTLAQPVPAQQQSHATPAPNTSADTQNDSPTPVTETHR